MRTSVRTTTLSTSPNMPTEAQRCAPHLGGLVQLGVQVVGVRAHLGLAHGRHRRARRRLARRAQVPMQLPHGLPCVTLRFRVAPFPPNCHYGTLHSQQNWARETLLITAYVLLLALLPSPLPHGRCTGSLPYPVLCSFRIASRAAYSVG